jgi:hypothetical protein
MERRPTGENESGQWERMELDRRGSLLALQILMALAVAPAAGIDR